MTKSRKPPRQNCPDIPHEVTEVIEQANSVPCDERLATLEYIAASSLAKDGLPDRQGTYRVVDQTTPPPEPIGLIELVKQLGYEDYSPQYYSAHILTLANAVRLLRASGQTDAAITVGIELGGVLAEGEYHDMWATGRNAWSAGQKAALATWGSPAGREAKNDELRRLFDEERPKSANDETAYAAVAKRLKVTKRKVRRAVTGY